MYGFQPLFYYNVSHATTTHTSVLDSRYRPPTCRIRQGIVVIPCTAGQKILPLIRKAIQLVALMQQEVAQIGRGVQPHALPDASYARPAEVEHVQFAPPVPFYAYIKCRAFVTGAAQRAASKRWGCAACKVP